MGPKTSPEESEEIRLNLTQIRDLLGISSKRMAVFAGVELSLFNNKISPATPHTFKNREYDTFNLNLNRAIFDYYKITEDYE